MIFTFWNNRFFRNVKNFPFRQIIFKSRPFKYLINITIRVHIPLTDISIKLRVFKHITHISYIGHIPFTNVAIKLRVFKHITHISHIGHIPFTNVAIKLRFTKQKAHICHFRNINKIQITVLSISFHCRLDQTRQMFAVFCDNILDSSAVYRSLLRHWSRFLGCWSSFLSCSFLRCCHNKASLELFLS